jgi:RNA polymerase sigma factor (sigma-70 family)
MERAYGRELHRFLQRRLPDASSDVPDLLQEVFLKLLQVPNHDTIRNPRAYLYMIAVHLLHQYFRRQCVASERLEVDAFFSQTHAPFEDDPEEALRIEQRLEALGRDLEQHCQRGYLTLILNRCEGTSLEKIGAHFGVSRVMANRYLNRATAYGQQRLKEI